jgi:3-dehydroquinate dehydratase-2
MKILVIHGPNLNLLGKREPEIYGTETLGEINERIRAHANRQGISVETFQSNHEGEIIDRIHAATGDPDGCDALVINPGAYTHYSIAIRDAIEGTGIPTVEVHLSDIHAREPFRAESVIAPVCRKQISGLGPQGYLLAMDALSGLDGPAPDPKPAPDSQ